MLFISIYTDMTHQWLSFSSVDKEKSGTSMRLSFKVLKSPWCHRMRVVITVNDSQGLQMNEHRGSIKSPWLKAFDIKVTFTFTSEFHSSQYLFQYPLLVTQTKTRLLRINRNHTYDCWLSPTAKLLFLINTLDGLDTQTHMHKHTHLNTNMLIKLHTLSWSVWRRIVPSKAWIHFSRSSASRAKGRDKPN